MQPHENTHTNVIDIILEPKIDPETIQLLANIALQDLIFALPRSIYNCKKQLFQQTWRFRWPVLILLFEVL